MVTNLSEQLRRDEGEILHAYPDQFGYLTIGVGRMIDARKGGGISKAESEMLLANDIADRELALNAALPWTLILDPVRRAVLLNMAFQMGIDGLLGFKRTLECVKAGDYLAAAEHMLDSKWAKQTPDRAHRLSLQMETGFWQ